MTDPWFPRLSEYLDGELTPAEHAACLRHLAACVHCRQLVAELGTIRACLGRLADAPSEVDLWPAIAHRLTPAVPHRPAPGRRPALFAAALALALLVVPWLLWRGQGPGADRRFLLLLVEAAAAPALAPEGESQRVAEYSRWAAKLARAGALVDAAKLADDGGRIVGERASEPVVRVGGFFVLRAADEAAALALAQDCPHLNYGGTVELYALASR